ncbi:hypothetical protein BG011_007832 [Mortierella polycephala]|uniref:Uncharacterized protein n=1 Tax=Mortierella polycephala TaxID=41804 RepID=A0A9P6PSD8_9FUNG|nr:hypothetical protein BG011_007832 [Mortierella polycephala]
MTIIEGIYFGIMVSKLKSKLVSYCSNDPIPGPALPLMNGRILGLYPAIETKGTTNITRDCGKSHTLVGALYILIPGGWIVLHSAWVLTVVLYSKALRRQMPADEELAMTATMSQPIKPWKRHPRHGSNDNSMYKAEMWSAINHHHYHQPTNEMESRNYHLIDKPRSAFEDYQDCNSDVDDSCERIRTGNAGPLDASRSIRHDIPEDGKGWWIRQIEANPVHQALVLLRRLALRDCEVVQVLENVKIVRRRHQ